MSKLHVINARIGHFVSQGFSGVELYRQLQIDPALPTFFTEKEVAELIGLSSAALRQRRARKQDPYYEQISSRCVRYPRHAVFAWLAERAKKSGEVA
jgi:predicted DNA-binding transcriptional regulator AlpA